MVNYTAENGLKVLAYLGINVPNNEQKLFKEKWNSFYLADSKELIHPVWLLYCHALPSLCANRFEPGWDIKASMTAYTRDRHFKKICGESGLKEKLENGISLEQILKE